MYHNFIWPVGFSKMACGNEDSSPTKTYGSLKKKHPDYRWKDKHDIWYRNYLNIDKSLEHDKEISFSYTWCNVKIKKNYFHSVIVVKCLCSNNVVLLFSFSILSCVMEMTLSQSWTFWVKLKQRSLLKNLKWMMQISRYDICYCS